VWMSDFTGNMPERNLNQPDMRSWEGGSMDNEEGHTCTTCIWKEMGAEDDPCCHCTQYPHRSDLWEGEIDG